jgi:hypothetical protein
MPGSFMERGFSVACNPEISLLFSICDNIDILRIVMT